MFVCWYILAPLFFFIQSRTGRKMDLSVYLMPWIHQCISADNRIPPSWNVRFLPPSYCPNWCCLRVGWALHQEAGSQGLKRESVLRAQVIYQSQLLWQISDWHPQLPIPKLVFTHQLEYVPLLIWDEKYQYYSHFQAHPLKVQFAHNDDGGPRSDTHNGDLEIRLSTITATSHQGHGFIQPKSGLPDTS